MTRQGGIVSPREPYKFLKRSMGETCADLHQLAAEQGKDKNTSLSDSSSPFHWEVGCIQSAREKLISGMPN